MNKTINLFRKFVRETGTGKGFETERAMTRGLETVHQKGAKAHRIYRLGKEEMYVSCDILAAVSRVRSSGM